MVRSPCHMVIVEVVVLHVEKDPSGAMLAVLAERWQAAVFPGEDTSSDPSGSCLELHRHKPRLMTCCACFRADVLLDVALEVHRAVRTGRVRAAGFPVRLLSRQSDAFSVIPELHNKAPLCEVTGRTWTPAVPYKRLSRYF